MSALKGMPNDRKGVACGKSASCEIYANSGRTTIGPFQDSLSELIQPATSPPTPLATPLAIPLPSGLSESPVFIRARLSRRCA